MMATMKKAGAISSTDYFGRANRYIDNILSGKIPACKFVIQACERQKKDLERKRFKYVFDIERAEHVCRFIEMLPHIKGKWAREKKLLLLEDAQIFELTTIFGWIDKRKKTRRFKTAYNELARKNGKSAKASGVALYMLAIDGESGAEVYSAATTRDQARIVFDDAKRMVEKSPGMRQHKKVKTSVHAIYQTSTDSIFKPLSRDQGGNHDGLNIHCAVVDELHAHKTRDLYDVIETGTGARDQPLLYLITTAGNNRAGICYEIRDYATKVLSGVKKDEEFFGLIYTLDPDDDWTDPKLWIKANPNLGVSVNVDDMKRLARKAMSTPSAVANFLTKRCNVWVNADMAFMDLKAWQSCGSKLDINDFVDYPCRIAFDLATKKDICSGNITFKVDDKYVSFSKHYCPEDMLEDAEGSDRVSQYSGWQRQGRLITTPGNVIDFVTVENDIVDLCDRFNVLDVSFDPWQSQSTMNNLSEKGITVFEYRNTIQNMSEPMKEWESLVLSKNYKHDNCPVMNWMVSNVVAHEDAKENIFPRKEFKQNKIDGAVAQIMCLGRWLVDDTDSVDMDDVINNMVII